VVTMAPGNVASINCEVASSLVCCPHVAGSFPVPRCGLRCGLKCPQRTKKVGAGVCFGRSLKPLHHGTSFTPPSDLQGQDHQETKDPEKLRDADAAAADGATACCQTRERAASILTFWSLH
jgi:hypothetical protein